LSYQPNPINEQSVLGQYVNGELQKIAAEIQNPEIEGIKFKIWYEEPDKPRSGVLYYADGTTWTGDGSSGEGFYRWTIAGAWVFVG